ncbi:Toll-like receptor 6 [Nymphon striatum]|nr:Toll-like receptor 6 [Nymphon striatum]
MSITNWHEFWKWGLTLVVLMATFIEVSTFSYIAPEDCNWQVIKPSGSDVALKCTLRTINSAFDNTNFSLIQPEHTVRLDILCSEVLFESYLINNSFVHLYQLKELTIEHCKLSKVPSLAFNGLQELKKLVLRTHNIEWGGITLDVMSNSLSVMHRLDHLDLSTNNIDVLPEGVFCPLKGLRTLNLSRNRFKDIEDLGLISFSSTVSESCGLDIRDLDISYNLLDALTDRTLENVKNLKFFRAHHNQVSRVDGNSLLNIKSLQIIDLSNNRLVALPHEIFQHSKNLKELHLQNNTISILAKGLLSNLQQLLVLDLSRNEITNTWVDSHTFSDLNRLVVLKLGHNQLAYIDETIFKSQYSLQVLHLEHNEIESITDNAFSYMYNLHTLVLTDNLISHIDPFTFNGLYVLSMLSIDQNEITTIHEEAFRNCSNSLQDLNLSDNLLVRTPAAIKTLSNLKSLDIGGNRISNINNASFRGLQQLYKLDLSNNELGNLSRGVFADMPAIRIINLHSNNIEAIEDGTFDDTPDLHAIRLDSNNLTSISSLFKDLHDLIMLNVSANRISLFDYSFIPSGLQWLDIHSNRIELLGNFYDQENLLKLKTLDASHNRINVIKSTSFPEGIEIVYLNDNLITDIPLFVFMTTPNLTRINLQSNKIERLDMNAFRMTQIPPNKPFPEFSVSQNPFLCDCNIEWLQRINNLDALRQYPRIVDLESSMCRLLYTRDQPHVSILHANAAQFLCTYDTHCFALCHCCDFDACDCEMICPENCTCYYDQGWYANIVDCSARDHVVMPERIPMDVTELYLDGNNIAVLSSHTFIGRKNMKVLFLNSSSIQVINNRTFNGLEALKILHLEDNELKILHGFEFERLVNLQELYLSRNRITFDSNSRLIDITLSHNLWSCECQFVEKVRLWLKVSGDSVLDKHTLRCYRNESAGPYLLEYNATTCNNYSATTFVQSKAIEDYVPMLVITVSVFLIILITMILILVYRSELRIWLHARFGVRLFHKASTRCEDNKLYDAYIAYSKKDESFVLQVIAPALERTANKSAQIQPSYRLCLLHRDIPTGMPNYVNNAISEAVSSSKRTILILSEKFLKSDWCRYELKASHQDEMLFSRLHKRLIVIVVGEIPSRDTDLEFNHYLKNCTFIHWGDKHFWEKLRYAMPDNPPEKQYQRHYGPFNHNNPNKGRSDVTMAVHI